jgi:hypothetical protein
MSDPTKTEFFYFGAPGDTFIRPIKVRIRATFSASGATVTVASTRRQSFPATITGASGTYAVAGLPTGKDYHLVSAEMNPGTGTKLINIANFSVFDSTAGTLTFLTRQSSDGAVTAPADGTVVYLTLDVETGVSF